MRKMMVALAALAVTAGAAVAAEALKTGDVLGTTEDAVKAALVAKGWEVRKVDDEDGMIEVYAVSGSELVEVYVDPKTGAVSKVKSGD